MIQLRLLRSRFVLIAAMLVSIATWAVPLSEVSAQKLSPEESANKMFALVNEWRMSEGAPALVMNPVMQKMAEDQAVSLLPRFDSINDYHGYHEDTEGRDQFKRARDVYNWPNYSIPERTVVGEIVAKNNLTGALNFWKGSPPHHQTVINPAYRESGIAALRYPDGAILFVMTFGARPNIIPSLLNPAGNQLFLSRENSVYAKDGKMQPRVRLFDEANNPLGDEGDWKATLDVPANAGARFYVSYKYGKTEIRSLVDRTRDVAIVPNSPMTVATQLAKVIEGVKPGAGANPVAPTAVAAAPTTAPAAPTKIPAVAPTQPPAAPTTATNPTPEPPLAVKPQAAAPVAPAKVIVKAAAGAKPDMVIYYSDKGMFVHNVAGKPINIKNMTIGRLKTENWLSIATFPAEKFSPDNCLQVGVTGAGEMSMPSGCKSVRSMITVGATRNFWKQAAFTVVINDKQVQECAPTDSQCEVVLPS